MAYQADYHREYVRRPEVMKRRRARSAKRYQEFRERFNALKKKPCKDCKNSFPTYVMDFDHVRGRKVICVSHLVNVKNPDRLLKEAAKCDLVCANCHRKRTHERRAK